MASAWGLIIASGKPEGFTEGVDPSFLTLGSKPVMMHALSAFEKCADVEGLVILASKDRVESVRAMVQMFGCAKVKRILPLAGSRSASVLAVVKELQGDKVPVVTIHEGIRPMVSADEIAETVKLAKKHGAAVLCDRLPDPVPNPSKWICWSRRWKRPRRRRSSCVMKPMPWPWSRARCMWCRPPTASSV